MTEQKQKNINPAHQNHPRVFNGSKYVYPVLSRRSGGISIGINLSPDRVCNFDCLYCQVKRQKNDSAESTIAAQAIIDQIETELIDLTKMYYSGELFNFSPFNTISREKAKLADFSFSGDGEPTAFPLFDQVCSKIADIRLQYADESVKIVLITNSTLLHKPRVMEGLSVLDLNNGVIWAKLDAGTEKYYNLVNRSNVSFDKIKDNILRTAQKRDIIIQTLFMNINDQPPSTQELIAYCNTLNEMQQKGALIKSVQIHTIAREPAYNVAKALSKQQLDDIVDLVKAHTRIEIEKYYGSGK